MILDNNELKKKLKIYITYNRSNVYEMAASEFCKSISALIKSILRLLIVLDPLKQISADLNKAKEVLALIHDIVLE